MFHKEHPTPQELEGILLWWLLGDCSLRVLLLARPELGVVTKSRLPACLSLPYSKPL